MRHVSLALPYFAIYLLYAAASVCFAQQLPYAEPVATKTIQGVTSINRLDAFFPDGRHALFVFSNSEPVMGIYRYEAGKLTYLRRADPWAYVGRATAFEHRGKKKVLVGYEYSRTLEEFHFAKNQESPKDKIKLVLYDENFENPEPYYEEFTQKGRISFLEIRNGVVAINFFHSDDYSKGGWLIEDEAGKVAFKRSITARGPNSVDVHDNQWVVGSPNSDLEERTQELRLYRSVEPINLPSTRGVSAVRYAQLDSDPEAEIVIADGLPNQKTKRGQLQLAVLDYTPENNSYQRTQVDTVSGSQVAIDRIDDIAIGKESAVLTKGTRFITLYRPQRGWEKKQIYRKSTQAKDEILDFALLEASASELIFAVLDGDQVKIMRYKL